MAADTMTTVELLRKAARELHSALVLLAELGDLDEDDEVLAKDTTEKLRARASHLEALLAAAADNLRPLHGQEYRHALAVRHGIMLANDPPASPPIEQPSGNSGVLAATPKREGG